MEGQAWQLLSIVVTLWSLALLYLPGPIFIFSPALIAATALFLILLRFSTAPKINPKLQSRADDQQIPDPKPKLETGVGPKPELDLTFDYFDHKPLTVDSFLEWDVRAPLEVIYEEDSENEEEAARYTCLQRQTSLSRYFPESDSDTSSSDEYPDWDSPGKICFEWDEDHANGLIEISLDSKKASDFEQEDNMIEIDISPPTSSGPSGFIR